MQDAQMIWYHFEVWVRAVKTWVSTALDGARSGIQLQSPHKSMILNIQRVETERKGIWTHVFCEDNVSAWCVTVSVASCMYSSVYLIATLQGQYHTYAKQCVIALENCNKDPHDMKLIVTLDPIWPGHVTNGKCQNTLSWLDFSTILKHYGH